MDTNGPFDYGLGQVPFKDQKRVRVPYGLPDMVHSSIG